MKKLNWNWTKSKGTGSRKVLGSGKEQEMRIQVEGANIENKRIHIWGQAIRDLRNCRDERGRADRIPMREFTFHTKDPEHQKYIVWFLHKQTVTQRCKTYGDAVKAIIGTTVDIRSDFLDER